MMLGKLSVQKKQPVQRRAMRASPDCLACPTSIVSWQWICQHSAPTEVFGDSRKLAKSLIYMVSAEGLEPSTP